MEDVPEKGDRQAVVDREEAVAAFLSRVNAFRKHCVRISAAYEELGDTQGAQERIRREMQKIMQQKEARSAYGKES